jgi:hypothetical protein
MDEKIVLSIQPGDQPSWSETLSLPVCLSDRLLHTTNHPPLTTEFGVVMPLLLQGYFWDHTGSLYNPNIHTRSDILNYLSDFLIGSTFRIRPPIGNVSIAPPSYQSTNNSNHENEK